MAFVSETKLRIAERRRKTQRAKMTWIAGSYLAAFAIGGLGLVLSMNWLISIALIIFAAGLIFNLLNPSLHDFSLTETKGNGGISFTKEGHGDD